MGKPLVAKQHFLTVALIGAGFLMLTLVGVGLHIPWLSALGLILCGATFITMGLVWAGAFVQREWLWRKRQKSRDRAYDRVRAHFE